MEFQQLRLAIFKRCKNLDVQNKMHIIPFTESCPLCHYTKTTVAGQGGDNSTGGRTCCDEKRGLFKTEALELLWMLYCPPATGLKKYKDSLWMAPQIDTETPLKLTSE